MRKKFEIWPTVFFEHGQIHASNVNSRLKYGAIDEELDVTTPYRQVLANYDNYKTDTESQNSDSIDRSKLLALVKRYLEHRKILADWEIIKQTPTEQLINYSGILVPFTPEEKQLLLEAKTLITRGHALEALYQSYIFDLSGEKSDQLH